MAATFKIGFKEYFYNSFGFANRDKTCRDTHYIGIIMLSCQCSQFLVPADSSTYSLVFISSNSYPVGATTNEDTKIKFTIFNSRCNRLRKIGIINRKRRIGSEILQITGIQPFGYRLFVIKPRMVSADSNLQIILH